MAATVHCMHCLVRWILLLTKIFCILDQLLHPKFLFSIIYVFFRETHIWYIVPDEVKSKHLQKHYLNLLSPNEKESVMKIQEEELQKRALLARALVRSTISRCKFSYCYFIFICNVTDRTRSDRIEILTLLMNIVMYTLCELSKPQFNS